MHYCCYCCCNDVTSHHAPFFSVHLCFVSTEYKSVDDDSGYGGANYKAKNHINGEVGCKGYGDSKDSLKSDGQQQDETPAIPCRERQKAWTWVGSWSTCISETPWPWQSDTGLYRPIWSISMWKLPHLETLNILRYYTTFHKMPETQTSAKLNEPISQIVCNFSHTTQSGWCAKCLPLGPCLMLRSWLCICVIVKRCSTPG